MDLVYLGSGAFGLPTLEALARRHAIRGIVTQPDRPAGRGGQLTPTPVAEWAAAEMPAIPVLKPPRINDAEVMEVVRAFSADAWVVIAFGQKLGALLLADRFVINLHASLLPRWRGAAPINAAILAGDTETGNSVITIADRMDAGDVLGQSRRAITPDLTAGELHDLLARDGPNLVEGVLAGHATGRVERRRQDESLVTKAPKLSGADRWIDFARPAAECRNRIHGLTPWPGVGARLGGVELKLCRGQAETAASQSPPGTLVDPAHGLVACAPGTSLRLLEVQPPGKRRMPWADFARGHPLTTGLTLVSAISLPHA